MSDANMVIYTCPIWTNEVKTERVHHGDLDRPSDEPTLSVGLLQHVVRNFADPRASLSARHLMTYLCDSMYLYAHV